MVVLKKALRDGALFYYSNPSVHWVDFNPTHSH